MSCECCKEGVEPVGKTYEGIKKNWGWLLFWGIVSIILGMVVIAIPYAATFAVEVLIGWFLVIGGVIHLFHAFHSKGSAGFIWKFLVSILYLAVGILMLIYPLQGMITLTVLLAAFFMIQGIFQIITAFHVKPLPSWGWLLFSGIIALILGLMIWGRLPSSATWAIGLLLGINLIFSGWAIVMFATAVKKHQ